MLCHALALFFVTRPGHAELESQLRSADEPLVENALRVAFSRNPFARLDTDLVKDYGLATVARLPRRPGVRLVGVLGKWYTSVQLEWLSWSPDYDILLCCALYAASFASFWAAPRFAWGLHTPRLGRPWTLVASGFASPTVLQAATALVAMVNVGTEVRRRFTGSSLVFWTVLVLPPVLATLGVLASDSRGCWPLGPSFGNIALASFGALADPRGSQQFHLFGQVRTNFFGCLFLEVSALVLSQPPASALQVLLPIVITMLGAWGAFRLQQAL
jgi:hypothetical protein